MQYLTVAQARETSGIKLVLSAGVPGPWSEAAKYIFQIKAIPFVPVAQIIGQPNEDLQAWAGTRSAPIVVCEGAPPKSNWADILMLSERLAPERPLMPDTSTGRAEAFGVCAEICGEGGFLWARRVLTLASLVAGIKPGNELLQRAYGGSDEEVANAPARITDILGMLAERLRRQEQIGSPYLVGSRLLACDIYWACASQVIHLLPNEHCPIDEPWRTAYEDVPAVARAACDPILIRHRDFIFRHHIGLPLDF